MQDELMAVLSSTSEAALTPYLVAEQMKAALLPNGRPSISALLDNLEQTGSLPAQLDSTSLAGNWQLSYTDEHFGETVEDAVNGVSLMMTVKAGEMAINGVVSQRSGERKAVSLNGVLKQDPGSPTFSIIREGGEQTSMQVTYLSDDMMILRKTRHNDDI
jgi:hypothetical protein